MAGLELVKDWSPDHPLYGEAQDLLADWSSALLRLAQDAYDEGNLDEALELAAYIPASSPLYGEARATMENWQGQWQRGEEIAAAVQTAIQQRQWEQASEQILQLGTLEHEFWRVEQADALSEQLLAEKSAWQTLQQVRTQVGSLDTTTPQTLAAAIAQVQAISNTTAAGEEAVADLQHWSQRLVALSLERWQAGDLDGAIALVMDVPPDLVSDPLGQDLIRLGQAEALVDTDQPYWEPSPAQIWSLREAIAAVQQISPDSPFYTTAQTYLADWQTQLVDLQQLQWASLIASLGHQQTFEWAIAQAEAVQPERPRRLQAQTLIAHWNQQIQRVEDLPLLDLAQQLAENGEIPDLQRAILVAGQIPADRALHSDAQGAIATWQDEIEIIEDKPLLEEAQTLAQEDRLYEAIRVARRIQPDRALHGQAQAAIAMWRNKIRETEIAADRPILDEAYDLAAREWYTAAIEQASQIGRGRALYDEAQAAIAQWRIARSAIWDEWETEVEAEADVQYEPIYSDPPAADYAPPSDGYQDYGYSEPAYYDTYPGN
jgi:hypothetical protein